MNDKYESLVFIKSFSRFTPKLALTDQFVEERAWFEKGFIRVLFSPTVDDKLGMGFC